MTPPRFVLYTRVSTAAQDQNNSHPTQLAALEAYALQKGGEVVEVIRETASGGAYLGRPGIRRALDLLESDAADVLACYDFSRYSRDGQHQQLMLKRIERMGKRLEFTNLELAHDEDGELTPESRLLFGVSGSFAEYHRAKITADSTRGAIRAAQSGQQPSRARAPYGYRIIQNHEVKAGMEPPEERGKYRILEEQATIVREIFALRCTGKSAMTIMEILNARGVPAPRGQFWHEGAVKRLLSSKCYIGEAGWRGTRLVSDESRLEQGYKWPRTQVKRPDSERILIPCPPIVSPEVFASAQCLLHPRSARQSRSARGLLTGLLRCPACGSGMAYVQAPRLKAGLKPVSYPLKERPTGRQPSDLARFERMPFYVCSRAVRKRETRAKGLEPCPRRMYSARDIEKRVVHSLRQMLAIPDFVQSLGQERQTPRSDELRAIEAEMEALQSERKVIVEAQIRALAVGADPTAHEELLVELSNSMRSLSARAQALESPAPSSSPHLQDMANRIEQSLWEMEYLSLDPAKSWALNASLGTLITKIEFNPHTGATQIHFT